MIRPATLNDIDALVAIEESSFETDKLSRRSFRHILSKGKATTLLEVDGETVRGYAMVLFNEGTSLARLYSIAVAPAFRSQGVAKSLLQAAESAALEHDCVAMRLEIRRDNETAIRLYKHVGYKQFGAHKNYYEDHMEALRFEKHLVPHLNLERVKVPFYEQTLDFTCGPAALMMAMSALNKNTAMNRMEELRIWRESTTIFMTSGHGGCSPYGLALSAYQRGFDVELFVNGPGVVLVDSVRDPEKKEVMRIVHEDFLHELEKLPVAIHHHALNVDELQTKFGEGGIPIVLISSYRIYREKFPHWVVVTGFDDKYIYVHDSFVDYPLEKSPTDCINMPILKKDFQRMARYGKAGQKVALIIRPRVNTGTGNPTANDV